jgi:uncharacterized damage-inducible protein DinB
MDFTTKAEFLGIWQNAKLYTEKVAAAMPQQHYTKRPTQDMRTFAEILEHIGEVIQYIASYAVKIPIERYGGASYDKPALIDFVKLAYDNIAEAVGRLDDTDFEKTVSFWAGESSVRKILNFTNDHSTHHRGQLTIYLRLQGIKPPSYIGW